MMRTTIYLSYLLCYAKERAKWQRHQFVGAEQLLMAFISLYKVFYPEKWKNVEFPVWVFYDDLVSYVRKKIECVPEGFDFEPTASLQLQHLMQTAMVLAKRVNAKELDFIHVLFAVQLEENLMARELMTLHTLGVDLLWDSLGRDFEAYVDSLELTRNSEGKLDVEIRFSDEELEEFSYTPEEVEGYDLFDETDEEEDEDSSLSEMNDELSEMDDEGERSTSRSSTNKKWANAVICVNDLVHHHNPLVGRERELERTIQVLCRKDKNNPLHLGEPGVGKTALIYGLAARIERGEVPDRLKDTVIYQIDLGAMLAGTQYRGEFEKRMKEVLEGAKKEKALIYIDEMHNLVGAGQIGEGAMDASNILKPYLESGELRFIGATTYGEYNRYLAKSGALVRRFQKIDVEEPSTEEATRIVEGVKSRYEDFHHVVFEEGVVAHAVQMAARYINDRRLPDKAIDLLDEASAFCEIHLETNGRVSKECINNVLAKICNVDSLRDPDANDDELLRDLETHMQQQIYGQDRAIAQVVEAVQMSRAGLNEAGKPIANFLFVGPTGVGKTELAKVLAKELNIELLRFDMSEYAEKHTVARLIGAPAGYVGYEDGGLLTDAVRKTPHCVLLLDEIEKAHPDIFNLLLQVMDYASLTDSKGVKVDFRHAVLIMTSNAGAQFARQASVGFGGRVTAGDAMMKQVKKTFKPEFLNRLSATVVFNDMDAAMARRILDKKLHELSLRLRQRNVVLSLSDDAMQHLLSLGYTPEYGAREMDRMVAAHLNPLLTRALLFGKLRQGGEARVSMNDGNLALEE